MGWRKVLPGGIALAMAAAGCELVEPIGPFSVEELDRDEGGVDAGSDATLEATAARDVVAEAEDALGDADGDVGDAADEERRNPCPRHGIACCGADDAGNPGNLYCEGFACTRATCAECLALGCDPENEFCCVSAGDTTPVACLPWGEPCGL